MTTSDELEALREKARVHQTHLDRDTKFFNVGTLATRWGCSSNTVRAIAHSLLPYMNVGQGLKNESRRYRPDDVYAYELTRLERAG